MLNKLITLLKKDTQIARNFFLLLIVFLLLYFLKTVNNKERNLLEKFKAQKELISQIPALEDQLSSPVRNIVLNGIILNAELPMAIINNILVKEGGFVTGTVKVVSIKPDSVILNDGIKDFELKLRE